MEDLETRKADRAKRKEFEKTISDQPTPEEIADNTVPHEASAAVADKKTATNVETEGAKGSSKSSKSSGTFEK